MNVIQVQKAEPRITRYKLSDYEWTGAWGPPSLRAKRRKQIISSLAVPKSPLLGRAIDVLQIARCWTSAADLPDVSNVFAGIAQCRQRCQISGYPLLCMGLFSIFFGWERQPCRSCGCLSLIIAVGPAAP